MYVGTLWQMFT